MSFNTLFSVFFLCCCNYCCCVWFNNWLSTSTNHFANASFSFCNTMIYVIIVHLLSPTLRAIFLNWSTINPNPSSASVSFTSYNSFVMFIMATPFFLESWWRWFFYACYGKNLCSPCGIISYFDGCKFPWSFCYTTSNGCYRISFSIFCYKISCSNSWWYGFSCWCPIFPIWLMIATTSSSNIGSISSTFWSLIASSSSTCTSKVCYVSASPILCYSSTTTFAVLPTTLDVTIGLPTLVIVSPIISLVSPSRGNDTFVITLFGAANDAFVLFFLFSNIMALTSTMIFSFLF